MWYSVPAPGEQFDTRAPRPIGGNDALNAEWCIPIQKRLWNRSTEKELVETWNLENGGVLLCERRISPRNRQRRRYRELDDYCDNYVNYCTKKQYTPVIRGTMLPENTSSHFKQWTFCTFSKWMATGIGFLNPIWKLLKLLLACPEYDIHVFLDFLFFWQWLKIISLYFFWQRWRCNCAHDMEMRRMWGVR